MTNRLLVSVVVKLNQLATRGHVNTPGIANSRPQLTNTKLMTWSTTSSCSFRCYFDLLTICLWPIEYGCSLTSSVFLEGSRSPHLEIKAIGSLCLHSWLVQQHKGKMTRQLVLRKYHKRLGMPQIGRIPRPHRQDRSWYAT